MTKPGSTVAQEVAIGRRHSPDIAWPTIRLTIGVYAALGASIWAGVTGAMPYWASAVLNTIVLYGAYTVVHEAVHNNIVPRISRLRWVNKLCGFAICPLLWLFFHPHKKSHTVHHTRCNTDEDPDIYARGRFGVVTFWRIPLTALKQLNPLTLRRDCDRFGVVLSERRLSYATYATYLAVVVALVAAGYGFEVLVLWFIPWLVGYSAMLVMFTWAPHHPHTETGRYRNTRCSIWPGANLVTQGQHMHLIHHMMPWIPYYQYEAVFQEVRPYLVQHNVTIDGFLPRTDQLTTAP